MQGEIQIDRQIDRLIDIRKMYIIGRQIDRYNLDLSKENIDREPRKEIYCKRKARYTVIEIDSE